MSLDHRLRKLRLKLRSLLRREAVEHELDEELRFHIERQIEHNVAQGMTPEEARLAAMKAFGGVEQRKEECRDRRGLSLLDNCAKDLRYAFRRLAQRPVFSLAAILTIVLGTGVNTALFSVYNAVALRPLPVAQPNQVVRLKRWYKDGYRGDQQYRFSFGAYEFVRDHNDVFTSVVASSIVSPMVHGSEKFQAQIVSPNYFAGLGINAAIGRTFLPDADRAAADVNAIVLSHPFWARQFHSDPNAVGQVVQTKDRIFTIVGIAPESFTGTTFVVPDFWALLSGTPQHSPDLEWLNGGSDYQFEVFARLQPSIAMAAAQAQVDTTLRQYWTYYREPIATSAVTIEHTSLFGNVDDLDFRIGIAAAMSLMGLILIVACANLANMMLASGAVRQREIGVRLALGASRSRIVLQLLTESIVLAIFGGIGGLLLSTWTLQLLWERITRLVAVPLLGGLTVLFDFSPDIRVLGYALFISAITALLFGLVPALHVTASAGRVQRSRLRSLFIGSQVAISMFFLVTAALLMRGILRAQNSDVGFETRSVFMLKTDFGQKDAAAALQHRVIERLKDLPQIRNVAQGFVPLTGTWDPPIVVDRKNDRTLMTYASDSFFDLLDIPILHGRGFTPLEAREGAGLAVISESTARRFWRGEDPLSKRFKLDLFYRGELTEYEVIGIAKDVRFANATRIDPARVYLPTQTDRPMPVLFRIQGNRETALSAVRQSVESVDPKLVRYLELANLEDGPLLIQRLLTRLGTYTLASLAVAALLLAAIGIYGVMAYVVGQRTKEIGIRIALGASWREILRSIGSEGLPPVFVGMSMGLTAAMLLSWILHRRLASPGASDFLQGVPFYDPVTFIGVSCFLILVASLASLVPARRALKVDPLVALRWE